MSATVAAAVPMTHPIVTEEQQEFYVDVAEKAYSGAKDAWMWGKGVPVVSIGLGITEGVVGKAVTVMGTDLEHIDSTVLPRLAELDEEFLNPTLERVIAAIVEAKDKTEEAVKPIVVRALSPLGLMKNENEVEPAAE